MPIYEYYCSTCKQEFEALKSLSQADEPANCKTCSEPGERLLSTFSFKSNTFTAPKLKPATKPRRAHEESQNIDSTNKG